MGECDLKSNKSQVATLSAGGGFNLLAVFVLFPLTIILLVVWLLTQKKIFGLIVLGIFLGIFTLSVLGNVIRFFTAKKQLDKRDFYGTYVIDRTQFAGRQANWQYNHFRFEVTKDNKFNFYVTDKDEVKKVYRGTVSFVGGSQRPRMAVNMANPTHHVIEQTPTLYRKTFSFYYVFTSPKFGNMFFKKGDWEPIGE